MISVTETDTPTGRLEDLNDPGTTDEEILHDLALFIHHGKNIGKMELIRAAARKLHCSKRRVLKLLEEHTGEEDGNRWRYVAHLHRGGPSQQSCDFTFNPAPRAGFGWFVGRIFPFL